MTKNLLIATFCTITLNACNVKQPVYLATENVRLSNIRIKKSSVKASIKLYNPNTKVIQLKSADIDVFLQNLLFGKIAFDTLLNMPPLDTFYVPVTGKISMKDALPNTAILLLKDSINIKLRGKVRAGMKGFYKNVAVNYEGKQPVNRLLNDTTLK
jgi:LEA14-like dessication related protein